MSSNDPQLAAGRVYADLSPRERRRVFRRAALRTLASLAVLIGIYVIVPPQDLANGDAAFQVVVGIILLLGLVAWEIWRVVSDPYPEVRAATGLLVLVAAVVILFSLAYATMSAANPEAFNQALDKNAAVYYTVTALTTTGFGDIAAVSTSARWVVTTQMLFDLVLLVGLARVLILAAKAGRLRRSRETG